MTHPAVVSREKCLFARKGLLANEPEFTMAGNPAQRRSCRGPLLREAHFEIVGRPPSCGRTGQ
jgi:hypothetical protein